MDEFKPEDELKPDTSDRRPTRQQKRSHFSVPKIELSRQHLMIAIGILVLVLLIIGIGSALQAPSHQQTSQPQSQGEKSIDLSSSSPTAPTESAAPVENPSAVTGQAPQTLSAPPVSDTPTQAPVQPPVSGQQRIELPGNITDALAQQQGRVDEFSQGAAGGSTLPTAPATVAPTAKAPAQGPAEKPSAAAIPLRVITGRRQRIRRKRRRPPRRVNQRQGPAPPFKTRRPAILPCS